ncbi:MAG: RNase adapter RapZ [Deltaproteobacteria bacterium]|nr:RNase adapter RapZ [Deltaproteobacteria bacterium]
MPAVSALHVVVVTGMSGAGRSSALRVLEDLGFYCVDNLPPQLAPELLRLFDESEASKLLLGGAVRQIGLGIDVRTGAFLESAGELLDRVRDSGHEVDVLFLDCADDALVRRYSETRRPHPLAPGGDVMAAISRERDQLSTLRQRATHVIDTSRLSVHELRRALVEYVGRAAPGASMRVRVVSFGFKYGLPVDADLVFDVRFLDNPHFVPHLRPQTGLDAPVRDYVLGSEETKELVSDVLTLLGHTLPRYEREGKAYLTVAIGCTGGRHRSVAIAEHIAERLRGTREIVVAHRDITR